MTSGIDKGNGTVLLLIKSLCSYFFQFCSKIPSTCHSLRVTTLGAPIWFQEPSETAGQEIGEILWIQDCATVPCRLNCACLGSILAISWTCSPSPTVSALLILAPSWLFLGAHLGVFLALSWGPIPDATSELFYWFVQFRGHFGGGFELGGTCTKECHVMFSLVRPRSELVKHKTPACRTQPHEIMNWFYAFLCDSNIGHSC